jgi:hypothetical protein
MTIDGKDILSAWGIILTEGSYSSLFKYPRRKAVKYSDYAERDGIVPDLRKIEFEPRPVTLNFAVKHSSMDQFWNIYQTFFADMTAPGYRVMDLKNGLIHSLRYNDTGRYESPLLFREGPSLTSFGMNFIEDTIAIPGDIRQPQGGIPLRGCYEINRVDFADFGIHPDGQIGNILKYPSFKAPFTDGKNVYPGTSRYKHLEVSVPLWMLSGSKEEFVTNYSAFFNQFNRPGALRLFSKEIGGVTNVYYKDCSSFTVHWGQRVSARFSITLVIPVATWLDVSDTRIITVLNDIDLGVLADEKDKVVAFNR